MASGHIGIGRAWEPNEVVEIVDQHFLKFKKFSELKLLLNLGKTRSWIDAVRYITNASTGKMGLAIRDQASFHFQKVTTVFGDNDFNLVANENNFYAQTNEAMLIEMKKHFEKADVVICSAALYDFEVTEKENKKIEKRSITNADLQLNLKAAVDVLYELGKIKTHQFLVGFSLANDFDLDKAWTKIKEKI
ncbi:phosphopantothenoylcysteine decarboxylase [Spiroplasma clarkii]|uniref:phosphopantothenoylcysteine decarboxylase domain-containing protein n=1 Tax=Spiroplasma clarkii TaxID=2139 RepID=UPI0011BA6484|nr:phosphopantothenoylcysteine decarboxylase [Spiroplasma clarkii]